MSDINDQELERLLNHEPEGDDIQEDEWGGGFQSASDAHKEVQAGLKGDFQRERAQKLKLIVQVIRGEITKQKFKKLTGYGFDELMRNSSYYRNQIKRMSKKALAPVVPVVPTTPTMKNSYESDGGEIQENVSQNPFEQALAKIESFAASLSANDARTAKLLRQIIKGIYNEDNNAVNKSFSLLPQMPLILLFKELSAVRDYQRRFMPKIKESYGGEEIQEKVDVDGRTRAYRDTVLRLEAARKFREERTKAMQENRFGGLYDDGSGKGAVIPAPVDFNFHEAMRIVEKYRSLREKKRTLMGAPKEDMNTAVVMKGDKFSMSETELSPKQKEFRTFFKKALTKFGKSSPAKMDDTEKKKFFNWIEKNWKG